MSFFRKVGKHYLCSEGQEKVRIFVATICFGKMVLFWCPFKVTKHYKNRGFSRHGGKPKMALLVAKVPFWVFPRKGAFTICDTQKLCSAENTIFIVFSAKHSFVDMKECNLKKSKNLPKIGVVCQNAKGFFWGMFFFAFWWFCFFVACVFVLVFCKKAPKGYFPAILEVFCLFCSPKRPVLKCFFSSFSVFFPGFPFFFPFKIPFFSLFFVHQPLFGKDSLWGFLLSFYFVFSFLNVCFFVWSNFLTSPFWTPSCFCFFFCIFSVVFVFVFMVYVSAFLFWCWLCFVMFLFCFDFVFVWFLVFCFRTMKKTLFSLQFSCFCRVGFKVVYCFSVSYFRCCLYFLCCFQF